MCAARDLLTLLAAAALLAACATAAPGELGHEHAHASGRDPGAVAAASATPRKGFVVSVSDVDVRTAPSGTTWIHPLATGQEAFFGVLRLAPGAAVPENVDPTEEFIYVLQGSGELVMDGERFVIGPGHLVYMPPGVVVSFQNGPDEELVAVQVFAGPEPALKYDAWKPASLAP